MYRLIYGTALALTIAALPAALALAVLAGALDAPPATRAALGAAAAVALVLGLLLRTHEAMVHRRAGQLWPFFRGNLYPRDVCDFERALNAAKSAPEARRPLKAPPLPTVVGSGWAFFAKRRGPQGPRIFLHRMRGRVSNPAGDADGTQTWLAGTTIAEVSRALYREGKCFWSSPTMSYISIGAWFALGNHGNGGKIGKPSSYAFGSALVYDLRTAEQQIVKSYEKLRELFDKDDDGDVGKGQYANYAIVSVTFVVADTHLRDAHEIIRKRRVDVTDAESAEEWLDSACYQRVLFLGAARRYALGIVWEPLLAETDTAIDHRDPHCCSRFCMYLQSDVCSAIGGCDESKAKWSTILEYAESNRWIPQLVPLMMLSVVLTGHRNFEVVFHWPGGLTKDALAELVRALIKMHKTHGGRTEIRTSGRTSPLFLDVVTRASHTIVFELLDQITFSARAPSGTVFKTLSRVLPLQVALHPGKWSDPREIKTTPCKRVPLKDIYFKKVTV